MKFKNETGKLKSFSYKEGIYLRWVNASPGQVVDVPDKQGWRARAHGLTEVKSVSKPKPKKKPAKKVEKETKKTVKKK